MRRPLVWLVILMSWIATTGAAAADPLRHSGRWLVDSGGRVVTLHGVNMVAKLAPYEPAALGFGERDARFLARAGLDVVRLGVIYTAVEPTPGHYDDRYLASIAQTVKALARHGVLALLDFHQDMYNERFFGEGFPNWAVQDDGLPNSPNSGFPGNLTLMPAVQHAYDHFWADAPAPDGVGLLAHYAAAWRHVAHYFRNSPSVLGYDLFNEPWPGSNWAPCLASTGCPAFDRTLGAMQKRTIAAIRKVDRQHLVFYEPDVLFNFGVATHLPPLGDSRAAMSFHDYCLQATVANPQTCAASERAALANADAHSRSTGDALMLSEFGATQDFADLGRLVSYADDHMVSWAEWAYCGCGDPTGSIPPSVEALVLDPSRPPSGANVDAGKLALLARPYPRAVAGTPVRWHFDAPSRKFTFTYSTRRAGGGRFNAGAKTELVVPAAAYPHGFRANVRGATVASRGDPVVTLKARRGVGSVSVTLTPRA